MITCKVKIMFNYSHHFPSQIPAIRMRFMTELLPQCTSVPHFHFSTTLHADTHTVFTYNCICYKNYFSYKNNFSPNLATMYTVVWFNRSSKS